jgi:tetratricopeptide (TPR) repeat protein
LSASLSHALGVSHTNLGHFDAAERELLRALEIRERQTGKSSAETARTLSALGNLARSRGQFSRALELHNRALAIDQHLFGAEHPVLARHHHNLAGVLRRLDKPAEALKSYERALALETRGFGPRHAAVGLTHNSIGLLELDRNAADSARRRFESALEILQAAGHPDRGVALHNLGLALAALGRHADALSKLSAALVVYRQTLGQRHERVAALLAARAESEQALGDHAAAVASRKQALEIAREAMSSSPDAERLVAELEAKSVAPSKRSRAAPPKVGSARSPQRPLGSTTYAPAQTWDPD